MTPKDELEHLEYASDFDVIQVRATGSEWLVRTCGEDNGAASQQEFTLRKHLYSRQPTQYHKVMAGQCDFLIYGKAAPGGIDFAWWTLIDLNVWRETMKRDPGRKGSTVIMRDGTFVRYFIDRFPRELVIKQMTRT